MFISFHLSKEDKNIKLSIKLKKFRIFVINYIRIPIWIFTIFNILLHNKDFNNKFEFYLKCEKEKRPHMGKWWDQNEINILAKKLGWKYKFIEQPNDLVTSYYRFDVLLVR